MTKMGFALQNCAAATRSIGLLAATIFIFGCAQVEMEAVQAVQCAELAVGSSDVAVLRRGLLEFSEAIGLQVDASSPSMLRMSGNDGGVSAEVVVMLGLGRQRVQVSRFEYAGGDASKRIYDLILQHELLRDSEVLECDGESGMTAPVFYREVPKSN